MNLLTRVKRRAQLLAALRPRSWLSWPPRSGEQICSLELNGLPHPVFLRPDTSDQQVFHDVFLDGTYVAPIPGRVTTAIDAGANIGLTTLFFLRTYPGVRVVAIEPNPDNFAVALRNLTPYGDRVALLCAALWPSAASLSVRAGMFRDGQHWGSQVVQSESGTVDGVTVTQIMDAHGIGTLDILKIDIEGAEVPLLEGDTSFLSRVRCVLIELHEEEFPTCRDLLRRALAPYGFALKQRGQTTIAIRS